MVWYVIHEYALFENPNEPQNTWKVVGRFESKAKAEKEALELSFNEYCKDKPMRFPKNQRNKTDFKLDDKISIVTNVLYNIQESTTATNKYRGIGYFIISSDDLKINKNVINISDIYKHLKNQPENQSKELEKENLEQQTENTEQQKETQESQKEEQQTETEEPQTEEQIKKEDEELEDKLLKASDNEVSVRKTNLKFLEDEILINRESESDSETGSEYETETESEYESGSESETDSDEEESQSDNESGIE